MVVALSHLVVIEIFFMHVCIYLWVHMRKYAQSVCIFVRDGQKKMLEPLGL